MLADTKRALTTGVTNEETCVAFVALLHPDDRPDPGAIRHHTVTGEANGYGSAAEDAVEVIEGQTTTLGFALRSGKPSTPERDV